MNSQILTWVLTLLAAYLGIKWKASVDENNILKQRLSEKKEKLYTSIISFYMDSFERTITKKEIINKEELVSQIRKFNEEIILTGSNKVVLTYADLMQRFYKSTSEKNNRESVRFLGELILVMREDLGHKDLLNSLYWFDTLRPFIKDIDNFLPMEYKGDRRKYSTKTNIIG